MRRVLPPLLAFLSILFIAAAITIPTYLVPKLKVVPLDLDITSDATSVSGTGDTASRFPALIFDRCSVSKDKAAQLKVNLKQQRRSLIVDPSDANQATLQAAQTVLIERIEGPDGAEITPTVAAIGEPRKCDDGLLTANIDRVSVDRKSSAPNGVVSSLQLEGDPAGVPVADVSVHLADRKGFQYKFGFDVQKQDYYYYDLNTRQDTVTSFVEETTVNGLTAYHFRTEVPETDISELPNPQGEAPLGTILNMPAKWWGITGRGVAPNDLITMHRHASAVRHVYVEPVTGTIVDGYEEQRQYFKSPDNPADIPAAVAEFRMDALNANFQWAPSTVEAQVDRATEYVSLLRWGGTIVPIILGVLGALLLALWAWLTFRGRDDNDPADDDGPIDDDHTTAYASEPDPEFAVVDETTEWAG
ncbi:MAG: DUF3068 domain-containing protein, partial [Gordonia sp. (in: high G+C Gram-positive bacteria)]|uniref:DUF3068 domain-containing protein n=1 Tax=Gordonia sp. (in: high G+C Gram-positive bacteria) TaxID=84139 RepID=UPI003BB54122